MNELTSKAESQVDAITINCNQAIIEAQKAHKTLKKARQSAEAVGYGYFLQSANNEFRLVSEIKSLKQAAWLKIIDLTGIKTLMDSKSHQAMYKDLQENPMEVTKANILSVLQDLYSRKDTILANSLINVFKRLDRDYKSNSRQAIKLSGKKAIIFVGTGFGRTISNCDQITDLDRILHFMDGKSMTTDCRETMGYKVAYGDSEEVESEYLRVKMFKNGNAHIYFKRPDLIDQCNRLIAYYHKNQLGHEA